LRVLRCLRECDVIFAEDTRVSEVLLRHFEVRKPVRSFHERVESKRLRELADLLASGKTVAVVTDAGMPGISDPGVELIRVARETSAAIEVLPGPSALLGALVLSGFDIGRFRFEGFPPRKASQRRTYLGTLRAELVAVVWYEAPSRVRELLGDIAAVLESRRVFVLREYTKKFEEQLIGTAADVLAGLGDPPRGEFVVVLEGASPADSESERVPDRVAAAMTLLLRNGVRPRLAVDALVTATGLHRNDLYALAQSLKAEE
jgi:16S rRNA (cytidine1402-2'-O)-methyltransferase